MGQVGGHFYGVDTGRQGVVVMGQIAPSNDADVCVQVLQKVTGRCLDPVPVRVIQPTVSDNVHRFGRVDVVLYPGVVWERLLYDAGFTVMI